MRRGHRATALLKGGAGRLHYLIISEGLGFRDGLDQSN